MFRAVTATLLIVSCSLAANFTEIVKKNIDASDLKKIEIFTTNGNISIQPTASDQIHLKAIKKVKGSGNKKDRLLKSINIEFVKENGVLKIKVRRKKTSAYFFKFFINFGDDDYAVDFELEVPTHLNVKSHSTNGDIEIYRVPGSLQLATTNGDIKAIDVQNVEEIHSTNGKVKVEFKKLPKNGEIEVSTTNGKIDIIVPEQNHCNIKAFTNNGQIACHLPLTNAFRTDTHLEINNGVHLATLFLKTTNGDINIYAR